MPSASSSQPRSEGERPPQAGGAAALAPLLIAAFLLVAALGFGLGVAVRPRLRPERPEAIANDFHKLYYDNFQSFKSGWLQAFWLGMPVAKCPLDLFVFQEIIYQTQPDVIVEAGTWKGGSALFMASILDLLHKGRVVTIDLNEQANPAVSAQVPNKPRHPRITYLLGSSTSPEIAEKVKSLIQPGERVMVDLDSDHQAAHVLQELRIYGPLVTKGNYLIVEDTNMNGHPVQPTFGPGPMEAVDQFLGENKDFVIDGGREKFILTFNPRGYLRKIK